MLNQSKTKIKKILHVETHGGNVQTLLKYIKHSIFKVIVYSGDQIISPL